MMFVSLRSVWLICAGCILWAITPQWMHMVEMDDHLRTDCIGNSIAFALALSLIAWVNPRYDNSNQGESE